MKTLEQLLNSERQVTRWPKDKQQRVLVLHYLASKFNSATVYHELEVNELLKKWHTFQDWSGLRRELIVRGYLTRNTDGTEYRKILSFVDFYQDQDISCQRFHESHTIKLTKLINKAYAYQDEYKGRRRITEQELRARAESSDLYVFESNDKLIGCVYTKVDGNAMHFGLLTVDESMKGQGIGASIEKAIESYAKSRRVNTIQLDYMSIASWLKTYYQKLGFQETGEVIEWGTIDLIRMTKQLS